MILYTYEVCMKNYCLRFGLTFGIISLFIISLILIPLCIVLNISYLKVYEIALSIFLCMLFWFGASFVFFLILGFILYKQQSYKIADNVIKYGSLEIKIPLDSIKNVSIKKLLFIYYVKIKSKKQNAYFYFNSKLEAINCVKELNIENKVNYR